MNYFGRKLYRNDTVREFTNEDEVSAPDEYVRLFMRCTQLGVTFIEIATSPEGPWQLWRVELLSVLPVMLLTVRCDEQAAHKELSDAGFFT